jgi:Ca2+-binding RTX toxin-like protein
VTLQDQGHARARRKAAPARKDPTMTATVINGYNTTLQTVSDTLLIGTDGILAPTAVGSAITVTGNYADVFIKGTVIGTTGHAIECTGFDNLAVVVDEGALVAGNYVMDLEGYSIAVENHGTINANNWGVAIAGDYARLVNTGTITGEGTNGNYKPVTMAGHRSLIDNSGTIVGGVDFYGSDLRLLNTGSIDGHTYVSSATVDVTNHGTMTSWGITLDIYGFDAGVARVFNDGRISGETAVSITSDADRQGALVNAGTLDGKVQFGIGNDLYDGREGKLFGEASMGGGLDVALGGVAAETMHGGDGFDLLEGNGGADALFGGSGDDTVDGGDGADTLVGGEGDDEIDAGAGHDWVFGQQGADVMDGGLGLDTLSYLGSAAGVNVNLATGVAFGGDAQNDIFFNFERVFGSSLNDTVTGSAGADTVNGFLGNDLIAGGAGNDLLRGGAGNDTIEGGAGRDVLYGGDGADIFRFRALTDSGATAEGRDMIHGFQAGVDDINVSLIDPSGAAGDPAFAWRGTNAFLANGTAQLRFQESNGNTIVQLDKNGDTVVDMSIGLAGSVALTQADFVL